MKRLKKFYEDHSRTIKNVAIWSPSVIVPFVSLIILNKNTTGMQVKKATTCYHEEGQYSLEILLRNGQKTVLWGTGPMG